MRFPRNGHHVVQPIRAGLVSGFGGCAIAGMTGVYAWWGWIDLKFDRVISTG